MPHVDVETLVSSCIGSTADRKVTCETMAKGDSGGYLPDHDDFSVDDDAPPDFPPESFWLSKDAELDWFDRNALFERKESGRGIVNSANLIASQSSNSNSQRFSTNLKATALIIGLPKAQQNYADSKRRITKPTNIHFFPKRSASTGKTVVPVLEPSSPKVSCIGRVRSKRCHRKPSEIKKKREKSSQKSVTGTSDNRKKGLYSRLISIFGGDKRRTSRSEEVETVKKEELAAVRETPAMRMHDFPVVSSETVAEPPTLGGMKNFVSGRRSGSGMNEYLDVVGSVQSEMNGSHETKF